MGKEGNEWVVTRTGRAPSNIAVIKYWGKRDEKLILPINSSISVTLDPAHLSATTTVSASPAFESDRLWLNGKVLLPSPPSVSSLLKIMTSLDGFPKASSLDCCFSLLLFRFPCLFLFWFWSFSPILFVYCFLLRLLLLLDDLLLFSISFLFCRASQAKQHHG